MYLPISRFMKTITLPTIVVLSLAHGAEAQVSSGDEARTTEEAGVAADSEELVILTYEVGDLVLHIADFPYPGRSTPPDYTRARGGGFGGGGVVRGGRGGMGVQNVSSSSHEITMDDLFDVLKNVVGPGSWDLTGERGVVKQLGTSLVVSQTRAHHRQIDTLLNQLRGGAGDRKTVGIDARWLLLDSDDLDRLIGPVENGFGRVDRETLAVFTRRPTSIRGLTNCFSGQLVYLISGRRQNVISGFIPVVGSIDSPESGEQLASMSGGARITFVSQRGGERGGGFGGGGFGGGIPGAVNSPRVGYQPIMATPNFGALLEIRPTLILGENTAVVELQSMLTGPGKSAGQVVLSPGPPLVDRISVDQIEFATTLRMPLGRPVLVGGLTYIPPSFKLIHNDAQADAAGENGGTTENRQLYLVLELR